MTPAPRPRPDPETAPVPSLAGALAAEGQTPAGTTVALHGAAEFEQPGRLLGQGGMGIVVEARQISLDRMVAVKTLHAGLEHGFAAHRFATEAQITGGLEHPSIIPVHAFGHDAGGRPYLAMKLVRGVDWARLVHPQTPEDRERAAAVPLREHLRILQRVCEAVSFAHARGIVHRDLKPHNVMVGEFGEVLVTDWGVALDIAARDAAPRGAPAPSATAATEADPPAAPARAHLPGATAVTEPLPGRRLCGTPAYVAPEQAMGDEARVGPWTDVFLLGGLLYELLTGRSPHAASTVSGALAEAAAGRVEPPARRAPDREIPPGLAEIAMRALEALPDRRHESAAAFARAIEEHLDHEASSTLALDAIRRLAALRDAVGPDPAAGRARRGPPAAEVHAAFQEATAELERALALWRGNRPAAEALLEARLAAAEFALSEEDPAFADVQLEGLPAGDARASELRARVAALRISRRRAALWRRALLGLLAAAVVVAAVAIPLGIGARRRADRAEAENESRRAAMALVEGAAWKAAPDRIAIYERALHVDRSWRQGYLELSGAYMDRAYDRRFDDPAGGAADLETSRRVLDRLLALAPDDPVALYYRGYASQALGEAPRALEDYARAASLAPETHDGLAAAKVAAIAAGRFADAERLATRAIETAGGDEDDFAHRAFMRFILGRVEEGLADVDRMGRRDPAAAEYDAYAALFLLALGRDHEASERLVAAIRKHPRQPHAFPLLALLAARRGDAAEARALLDRARLERGAYARCYLDLEPVIASVAAAPAPRDALGKAFVLALDLASVAPAGPAPGVVQRTEGFAALARGDTHAALSRARRALASDPADGAARLLRGLALAALGEPGAARADLVLVRDLAPTRAAEAVAALRKLGRE